MSSAASASDEGSEAVPEAHQRHQPAAERMDALALLERLGLPNLFAVVIVVFSLWKPATFATGANWRVIATSQAVVAVAALALMFPLACGRFDVSVGANIGICAVAVAAAMSKHHIALVPAAGIALALGASVGLLNGVLVAYFGVDSIIGTLGVGTILAGVVQKYTGGVPISTGLSPTLADLGNDLVLGIPYLLIIMFILAALAWYLLTQTALGRKFFAVGSNLQAAQLVGLPTRRIVLLSFVGAGLFSGAAGVLQVGAQGDADPSLGGLNFILPAIAAVFLGATTWRPGRLNVPGTIISLFFLGTTVSGLALVGAQPWVTDVFDGVAIVVAIALAAQFRRRRTGAIDIGL